MAGLSLSEINATISTSMDNSEQSLRTLLSSLGDGSTASVTDLIGLQYTMSVYTITGQTVSSIMKEGTDTMKSVIQKV